jgi:hypothetical protein
MRRHCEIKLPPDSRWTVIAKAASAPNSTKSRWRCRCQCGTEKEVPQDKLLSGWSRSCGCLRTETTQLRAVTHSMSHHPLYHVWSSMRQRCSNPKNKRFDRYGARGINVCERWSRFENFQEDMAAGYRPGLQLDRINNNGDYEPSNVRWVTQKEQQNNKSTNRRIEWRGSCLTLSEWADQTGIPLRVLSARLIAGWGEERALTTPVGAQRISVIGALSAHQLGETAA